MSGRTLLSGSVSKQNFVEMNQILAVGVYSIYVSYEDYIGDRVELFEKIMIY